ncbi:MAG TPA: DapH/DapD/GlmU-related protein [Candidatus Aquilonibacter sp.]|nr:DapH/DapD/GlmU-related protein [Candidatus Aquilonibacter sp.]
MILSSAGKKPKIHSTAYVAPSATVSGDVTIGANTAILHGAVIAAEGAPIAIGADCVVMENAVIKSSGGSALQFPTSIGDRCTIGAHAFISGATIQKGAAIGSGARIYNGVTVQSNSRVAPNSVKEPKGDFNESVFNIEQGPDSNAKAAQTYSAFLRKLHARDQQLDAHENVAPNARRRETDELKAPVEADTVVDVMMLELQEMEARRREALQKKPKR